MLSVTMNDLCGSCALGTVLPLGDDEYDFDTVCHLGLTADRVTNNRFKDMVVRNRAHTSSIPAHVLAGMSL